MASHRALCPRFHRAVELIGARWTGAIIQLLLAGRARFTELGASIPELSDRMLSERLRALEAEGIVERTVIPEVPVRIEYALTEKGRALNGALDAISRWAERWIPAEGAEKPGRHEDGRARRVPRRAPRRTPSPTARRRHV